MTATREEIHAQIRKIFRGGARGGGGPELLFSILPCEFSSQLEFSTLYPKLLTRPLHRSAHEIEIFPLFFSGGGGEEEEEGVRGWTVGNKPSRRHFLLSANRVMICLFGMIKMKGVIGRLFLFIEINRGSAPKYIVTLQYRNGVIECYPPPDFYS